MASYRIGRQSIRFPVPPVITCWASSAGKREAEGPLGHSFDVTSRNAYWGEETFEQAEQAMQKLTLDTLLRKARLSPGDIDLVFSGDLLNQCIVSSFALRGTGIPHMGLYGACSTMAEGLAAASMAVSGGFADRAVAMTSSHFASSERQYRFPLNYGGQRTPTSQWTVTGSGAALLSQVGTGPIITSATLGTVLDLGVTDANNMGSAMAPAALSTIRAHFSDLHTAPEDYDLIVTGDLGQLGKDILLELGEDLHLGGRIADCGCMVFDNTRQDVASGGSGCGCSAVALCGDLLEKLRTGQLHRILFCGTGALLSPLSVQQGLPIPGICHAIVIEGRP